MRDSFTVFTNEGSDLSEAVALIAVLQRCAAQGASLADEPDIKVDRVYIFSGEGYEEDVPRDLADLDAWSVEYTLTRPPQKRR
ncbi:hypothetical protein QFZ63_001538 [Streptomyces sp. B3I7]|uniref:hypothetical protein n=1 Tax=Streptomyces sp. B3I7 TaxID=3042269 RepID=UPI00278B88BB|nr:hypothetical protein [Streptomyces sp. B3I7]MDQ0809824.1 hypothetical protein [Streptomyces sp. B3I7]